MESMLRKIEQWMQHVENSLCLLILMMRINEKLGSLLTLLMEQSWHPESVTVSRKRMELIAVKEYLDEHYTERLALDDLAGTFFMRIYKKRLKRNIKMKLSLIQKLKRS